MTAFIFANNISTTLASAVSTSQTTITLASTQNLPASIPSGSVLVITLNDAATRNNYEIVYATAITGATLTVIRAQEGTAALAWLVGDYAYSGPTAGQQASFGELAANNTWTGENTFSQPVVVANATASGDAVNLGEVTSTTAPLALTTAAAPTNDNSTRDASTSWIWANIQSLVTSCIATVAATMGFAFYAGANGYLKLPSFLGGFIVQWGIFYMNSTGVGTTNATVIIPLAFPNSSIFAMAGWGGNQPPASGGVAGAVYSNSAVYVSTYTPGAGTYETNYLVIGY